ncbi:hypothetical protein DVH24_009226 [Malus domestica]|uniref:Uncharacterized protein n=1 Tax=Malus domestica TaxID=3750 RepID=A0A498IQQ3_MALDO|nr:hypothetical protein DVH24_009226 [Malus domestica]
MVYNAQWRLMQAFLDLIERDLFHTHMKSVTYLRLDGSVEPEKRFDIVKAFNSDPTIDVLLLTTHGWHFILCLRTRFNQSVTKLVGWLEPDICRHTFFMSMTGPHAGHQISEMNFIEAP